MELKEFLETYEPLIGSGVVDEIFNKPLSSKKSENGLTATMVLNKAIELFFLERTTIATVNNDIDNLEIIMNEIIAIANLLGLKSSNKWVNNPILPFSIGNNKIGDDTLIFNVSSATLCPSALKGYCKQCKNCYARSDELRHSSSLLRGVLSLYKLLKYPIDNIINSTIKAVKSSKKAKNCLFVRYNSNGDILNNEILKIMNKLTVELKKATNIKVAYTYTHNKNLNLLLSPSIVFNLSDVDNKGVKSTIVAYKWDKKYLDDSNYVICSGNCKNCPYCKNKNDKRTVVFMAHGHGFKGVKMLPNGLLDVLEQQKILDYGIFYSKLLNPKNLTLSDFL